MWLGVRKQEEVGLGKGNIWKERYCKTALRRISGHFNKRSYIDENYIARSVGA